MIEVVLFDADDTLWDFQGAMRAALHATLEELWIAHPGRESASLTVDRLIEIRDRVAHELSGRVMDLAVVRLASFERALEEAGIHEEGLAVELGASYFSHQAHGINLFEDTLPALDALGDRRLAIVSNGNANVARLGLEDRFEAVIRSVDVGVAKPDPAIVEAALTRMGVSAQRAVLVGDSEEADVAAARAAGIRSVLVDRDGSADGSRADWVIRSLRELPDLLAAVD